METVDHKSTCTSTKSVISEPNMGIDYLKLEEQYSELMFNYKILLKENDKLRRQLVIANSNGTNELETQSTQTETLALDCVDIGTNTNVGSSTTFSPENGITDKNDLNLDTKFMDNNIEGPCILFPGHIFSNFNLDLLDNEILYSHKLESRQLKYYGDYPYFYGSITHLPCPVPKNSYLNSIIEHLSSVCPNYQFNSVLVTKFESGRSFLPMHSDNEDVIDPDSAILTISLGATHSVKFQLKDSIPSPECSVNVSHGDVYVMSCKSQNTYKHGIPKDYSKDARISLTFRNIVPPVTNPINCNSSMDSVEQFLHDLAPSQPCQDHPDTTVPGEMNVSMAELPGEVLGSLDENATDTVYISSSMFRELSEEKLSSSEHKSSVMYYPGATAGGIFRKLQDDSKFKDLDPSKVKQVFLMCGSNDVDNILGIKRSDHNNININTHEINEHKLQATLNEMEKLVNYLHHTFISANVKVVNILPRTSWLRNSVINKLNGYIKYISSNRSYMRYINTELNICLFSNVNGYRKGDFFKSVGTDNVHLNGKGVIRLGRHLKYLAHN